MIRYRLICDQDHEFDGWFQNSAAFDEQVADQLVACPHCSSRSVSKGLMAPSIPKKSNQKKHQPQNADVQEKVSMVMTEVRRHIEENCDYVGDQFAEEARRIHYGETEHRDIYGEATLDEARDLVEEGVEVAPVPMTPKSKTN